MTPNVSVQRRRLANGLFVHERFSSNSVKMAHVDFMLFVTMVFFERSHLFYSHKIWVEGNSVELKKVSNAILETFLFIVIIDT